MKIEQMRLPKISGDAKKINLFVNEFKRIEFMVKNEEMPPKTAASHLKAINEASPYMLKYSQEVDPALINATKGEINLILFNDKTSQPSLNLQRILEYASSGKIMQAATKIYKELSPELATRYLGSIYAACFNLDFRSSSENIAYRGDKATYQALKEQGYI